MGIRQRMQRIRCRRLVAGNRPAIAPERIHSLAVMVVVNVFIVVVNVFIVVVNIIVHFQ